jgi:hypothetical protein
MLRMLRMGVAVTTVLGPDGTTTHAFSTPPIVARRMRPRAPCPSSSSSSPPSSHPQHPQRHRRFIVQESPQEDREDEDKNKKNQGGGGGATTSTILQRFSNPVIDDPFMPLTEAGLVQIVAPTMQLFWLIQVNSPYPSWAQPLVDTTFPTQGAFVVPTLIHGAALACCWLLGCLAAKAYETPNFRVNYQEQDRGYPRIVSTTIQAGAFACGILILATQWDLYQEFHGYVQWGESALVDARIYQAVVEVINDIVFQFIVLLSWRLFRSNFD